MHVLAATNQAGDERPLNDHDGDRSQLAQILDGLLAGDPHLWRALQVRISRYIDHRYSGSRAEREDIVADIMRTLLENLRQGRFRGENLRVLNSYIYGIARLQMLHAIRKAKRDAVQTSNEDDGFHDIAGCRSPETDLSSRELTDKILALVDPRSRQLLQLKFLEGWSDQEIADHMEMTKNAVSTAICRAIQKAQNFDFVKSITY